MCVMPIAANVYALTENAVCCCEMCVMPIAANVYALTENAAVRVCVAGRRVYLLPIAANVCA
jgi:hypothetical protein